MLKQILISCIVIIGLIKVGNAQVLRQDSMALVALYNSLGGANWTNNTNWLTNKKLSTWYGVYVQNNRVFKIQLFNNNLIGTIPNAIGDLTELTELSIGESKISGTLPSTMGRLIKLYSLVISKTEITGEIPTSLGLCVGIVNIYLRHNKLSGTIPVEIANCKALESFILNNNQLTGDFPSALLQCTKLRALDISHNQMGGAIPEGINQLTQLVSLGFSNNNFSGRMPSIKNLKNLESLIISYNQLSGDFDDFMTYYPRLTYAWLSNNGFTGIISPKYFNKDVIIHLFFNNNLANGMESFDNWSNSGTLQFFNVSYNKLDFDDLLPSIDLNKTKFFWYPQNPSQNDTIIHVNRNANYTLRSTMTNPAVQYKWYFNFAEIPGATGALLNINQFNDSKVGEYKFIATHPAFDSKEMFSHITQLSLSTSTHADILDHIKWHYYNKQIHINALRVNSQSTLQIYTNQGQLIMSHTIKVGEYALPIGDVMPGMYVVKISENSAEVVEKILIF